jgi:hypothetical protein
MKNKDRFQIEKSVTPSPSASSVRFPGVIGPSPDTTPIAFSPPRDAVSRRAYYIYLEQGSPQGLDVQHWLKAEAQVARADNARRPGLVM